MDINLSRHTACLCREESSLINRIKRKSIRISSFNGSVQSDKYKDKLREFGKVSAKLPYISKDNERSLPGFPKGKNILFKSWLMFLPSDSPNRDQTLDGPSSNERLEIDHFFIKGGILKTVGSKLLGINAIIKIPAIIIIPLFLTVNMKYGPQVAKELIPLWIGGPLLIALYIKMVQVLYSLYVFTFKQSVKVVKNFTSGNAKELIQVSLPPRLHNCRRLKIGVNTSLSLHGRLNTNERFPNRKFVFFASVDNFISDSEIESDDNTDQEDDDILIVDEVSSKKIETVERSGGRPGLISFYNQTYKKEDGIVVSTIVTKNQTNIFWFVGPAVLVSSFIFPSLFMRKILSAVFEDSLLTDFLILFFTEALFYCGVAAFLSIVDHLRRPNEPVNPKTSPIPSPHIVYRITSVAALVLSLMIPLVTMGLVWPWTGPAASATLAPYLVGIVVQFAFEQYARYIKSPSWPLIPVILQVYRLHQLNRAAQLVTALSFTVRGAESTPHNLAINSSLGMLLNVLQCLGVICIWSLSSFLMRFLPSATITDQ